MPPKGLSLNLRCDSVGTLQNIWLFPELGCSFLWVSLECLEQGAYYLASILGLEAPDFGKLPFPAPCSEALGTYWSLVNRKGQVWPGCYVTVKSYNQCLKATDVDLQVGSSSAPPNPSISKFSHRELRGLLLEFKWCQAGSRF